MKITILDKQNPSEEDEIIVKCDSLDEDIISLLNALKNGKNKLSLYKDSKIVLVEDSEVLYFESVDDRVFAYTADQVYESRQKLYLIFAMNAVCLLFSSASEGFLTDAKTTSPCSR